MCGVWRGLYISVRYDQTTATIDRLGSVPKLVFFDLPFRRYIAYAHFPCSTSVGETMSEVKENNADVRTPVGYQISQVNSKLHT